MSVSTTLVVVHLPDCLLVVTVSAAFSSAAMGARKVYDSKENLAKEERDALVWAICLPGFRVVWSPKPVDGGNGLDNKSAAQPPQMLSCGPAHEYEWRACCLERCYRLCVCLRCCQFRVSRSLTDCFTAGTSTQTRARSARSTRRSAGRTKTAQNHIARPTLRVQLRVHRPWLSITEPLHSPPRCVAVCEVKFGFCVCQWSTCQLRSERCRCRSSRLACRCSFARCLLSLTSCHR